MNTNKKIILGISCGDINGIGLEILIKSVLNNLILDACTPVLYVPVYAINFYKKLFSLDFEYFIIKNARQAVSNRLNIIQIHCSDFIVTPGISTEHAGKVALESLNLAFSDLKQNRIDVLVTLPVNKQNVSLNQSDFIGHTEYLSHFFNNSKSLMLLCSDNLKIATVTNHIPVSKVAACVTRENIKEKLMILFKTLSMDFLIKKPKVAVLGLNPHAGDDGLVGSEEKNIIKPVVSQFFKEGNMVYGPYAADGFFGSGAYINYDAILGMYHDQSLIPFKALSFGKGVNYTAGLPCVRVSPDHGVGYDIAGQQKAKINSFIASVLLAIEIYHNRLISKNCA